jgi:hypothetical protein
VLTRRISTSTWSSATASPWHAGQKSTASNYCEVVDSTSESRRVRGPSAWIRASALGGPIVPVAGEHCGDREAAVAWLARARAALPGIEDEGFRSHASGQVDQLAGKLGPGRLNATSRAGATS